MGVLQSERVSGLRRPLLLILLLICPMAKAEKSVSQLNSPFVFCKGFPLPGCLGTEAGYSCGSALGGSPHPSAAPRAGPGHSLKLRQLPAVAQVGGQRSHVLWSEDALG